MQAFCVQSRQSRSRSRLGGARREGITLIEMLTVIVIITLLLALLLPAMNAARESSRQAACASNLRQIGMAMQAFAQAENGQLCTGAFDWQRDGSATAVGWVADMVKNGTPVGKLLCTSNPAILSETYNDLLNLDVTSWQPEDPANPSTWTCGVNHKGKTPETLPDGSQKRDPCEEIIATQPAPSAARDTLVMERIYAEHYNTNYTASWFLVRTGLRLDSTGNPVNPGGSCETGPLARASTLGPMNVNALSVGAVASSFIPLLGDAAGDPPDRPSDQKVVGDGGRLARLLRLDFPFLDGRQVGGADFGLQAGDLGLQSCEAGKEIDRLGLGGQEALQPRKAILDGGRRRGERNDRGGRGGGIGCGRFRLGRRGGRIRGGGPGLGAKKDPPRKPHNHQQGRHAHQGGAYRKRLFLLHRHDLPSLCSQFPLLRRPRRFCPRKNSSGIRRKSSLGGYP